MTKQLLRNIVVFIVLL